MYSLLADLVILAHMAFIVFAGAGSLLLLKWPKLVFLHLPAVCWGVWIELSGNICPLTYLENRFHQLSSRPVYDISFIERYLLPVIYPPGLDRKLQFYLAGALILLNLVFYAVIVNRLRSRRKGGNPQRNN